MHTQADALFSMEKSLVVEILQVLGVVLEIINAIILANALVKAKVTKTKESLLFNNQLLMILNSNYPLKIGITKC